jgi:uncharacterized protein with HEPN domain
MSAIDDKTRLQHIRDAAQKIITFTEGKERSALAEDDMLQLALVRLVEIIGEAAARLSDDLKMKHSDIPWAAIVGMRNRLVHAYFDIDLDVVWDTVTVAVPDLLKQVETILETDYPNGDTES